MTPFLTLPDAISNPHVYEPLKWSARHHAYTWGLDRVSGSVSRQAGGDA